MENIVKSYIAGIIDGEGTVALSRPHKEAKFRYPVVSVASTTFELLDFLKQHYKGQIIFKKTYKSHHKPSGTWSLRGTECLSLLKDVLPYLILKEKSRRANLIISNYEKLTVRNGKYTPEQILAKLEFEREFFHPSIP